MRKLIIASANAHKIAEIRAILAPFFGQIDSAADAGFTEDVEETGQTFLENALIKARAVSAALKCWALADDSGLSVDALGGAPGVYSARYAGGHGDSHKNNLKLLRETEGVAEPQRTCRFVCAMALCGPDGETLTAQGYAEGRLLTSLQGEGGFGYDPLFYSFDLNKTFAEASAEEKNKVSHRARALAALARQIGDKGLSLT